MLRQSEELTKICIIYSKFPLFSRKFLKLARRMENMEKAFRMTPVAISWLLVEPPLIVDFSPRIAIRFFCT